MTVSETSSNPPIPILLPRFWRLVWNTIGLKLKYGNKPESAYSEYLNEYYDKASTHGDVAYYGDAWANIRPKVVRAVGLPPGSTVLDVATGRGYQAAAFAERGYPVVGVDLVHSRARTSLLTDDSARAQWAAGSATELPFVDDAFDAVTISLALHALPPYAFKRALSEFARVAKKRVVILEPRAWNGWLPRRLYAAMGHLVDESLFFWRFAMHDLEEHFEDVGLRLIRLRRVYRGNILAIYVCEPTE